MRVEALIGGNCSRAVRIGGELLEMPPIPITGKNAIVDQYRPVRINQMFGLTNRVHWADLVGRYAGNTASWAVLTQNLFHPVAGIGGMILVADEKKILLARKHVDDMGNDRFAVYLDQRFWHRISRPPEAFTEARRASSSTRGIEQVPAY
jgi:hypothetical protein